MLLYSSPLLAAVKEAVSAISFLYRLFSFKINTSGFMQFTCCQQEKEVEMAGVFIALTPANIVCVEFA